MISQLQYISQSPHLENIAAACDAGCNWIQLRVKNKPLPEVASLAEEARRICEGYNATLIINDHPQIAAQVNAHGVHVGQEDMSVAAARQIAGNGRLVGGTANTFDQIRVHAENLATYVGVGPFRFTATKERLSPILGLEGYKQILAAMKEARINLPLIAIGGLTLEDIPDLVAAGVHGIAVSGLITNAADRAATVKKIYQLLNA
ncbi:thiamine-phosphate diphosphorylase [Chitinophaga terrae (ex Kim and Jung 2007)]|uniref:Thiamine-phosphate synthase n=1 Tax=Chitinophaga terrae (ex Kim and Jung 2007) TaxID=408074 RepID=A0A1H4G5Z7_9BACT|nr:thiamine phosphate synthase [Chitinophaga terrae (ex Kim and Jung 2007)]GEP92956.1 thiamine-phosphate synthase [Chitinophaga terrae (ex Kim and Jung 2007)]SEB04122.1 thiamine-phosphate diphosphorylase [Chitinophaga terrae (ex Kim and Jung 2007)]